MNKSHIQPERCFVSSIDAAKEFVEYNEYLLDPGSEIYEYIMQLIAFNYDSTSARRASFRDDSFIAGILPESPEGFDAFVDVIADEMHTLLKEAYGLTAGSGLFVYATVDEQPVVAFFKLNYQTRFACEKKSDGEITWTKDYRLLPSHTQKEYDYFFINIFEQRAWMSDAECTIGDERVNYMSDRILQLDLKKSEKETVKVIQDVITDTIRECYEDEAPKKLFEYRRAVADTAKEEGEINPKRIRETLFADNEAAMESCIRRSEDKNVEEKPVYVSPKTRRSLAKKQKIVTGSGIELLVPIELLEDKNTFDFHQENGMVSITISDVSGEVK